MAHGPTTYPYIPQASLLVTVLASGLMARQQVLSIRFSHNTSPPGLHLFFIQIQRVFLRKALTEELISLEECVRERERVPPLFF